MSDWDNGEEHVERAHELFELGRWEEAEAELRKALTINPQQPEWQYNLGVTLQASGRLEEAVEAFRESVRIEPHHGTLIYLGINLNHLERPEEALEALREATRLKPDCESAYCPQISSLAMLGRHDEAEQVYYMARLVRDECAACCVALGESLLERRLYEKAVWCFKEALRLEPRLPRVHARLAAACAARNQNEQAYRLYLRDLREDPGNIATLTELGVHLRRMDRPAEAAEKFRRILELEPANADAHFHLGKIALAAGHHDQARIEFELLSKLNPDYPGLRLSLAFVMHQAGRVDECRRLLMAVMETLTPEEPDLMGLAHLLFAVGMLHDSRRVLEMCVEQNRLDPEAWHRLGAVLFMLGEFDAGMRMTRRAMRCWRGNTDWLRRELGNAPFRASCDADAGESRSLHNLILGHIRAGRVQRARAMLRRAQRRFPRDPAIRRLAVRFQTLYLLQCVGRWIRTTVQRRLGLAEA